MFYLPRVELVQPMLAHGLSDIQGLSLDSSLFCGKSHHLNHIYSVLALVPIEYFIYMYVLERVLTLGLPTHSTSTEKGTMLRSTDQGSLRIAH